MVENPRFTKERLPVVEDDEEDPDLVTPMVETRPLPEEYHEEEAWNVSTESELNHNSSGYSNAENEPLVDNGNQPTPKEVGAHFAPFFSIFHDFCLFFELNTNQI